MLRPHVILSNMFAAQAFLNDSLSESALYSCRDSASRWLATHALYSLCFTATISTFLYFVSLAINYRELFANPSVHYDQELERYERDVAIERGYRRLKFFLLQLIALTFAYVLGAYYYKSIVRSTPVDWMSITRWLIEASCDYLQFWTFFNSLVRIPSSIMELNNHFAVLMDILLIIKTNQFVMMRYAEFHSHACLNTMRADVYYYFFCPQLQHHSTESMIAACVSSAKYLPIVCQ